MLRTFGRNTWLIMTVFAVSGFGYFGIQAVLFNLYLLRLGYDAQFIGTLIGGGQLVWAAMALPAGALGRRLGSRQALMLWHSLHGLGFSIILCAEFLPPAWWTACIALGWMVYWTGGAFGGANTTPYLVAEAPREALNHVFSTQVALMAIMGFVGSLVAGALPAMLTTLTGAGAAAAEPYRLALILVPICHFTCSLILSRLSRSSRPQALVSDPAESRPLRLLVFWGVLMFLLTSSEGSVRAFFNVYLDKQLLMSTADIGRVFGLAQFMSILSAFSAPMLLRRLGASRVIFITTLGSSLVLLVLATLQNVTAASTAYVGVLLLAAVSGAARSILSQQLVQVRWRTIISAVQTVGQGLGWASAAAIGGALVVAFGFSTYFSISAGLSALAACLLAVFIRRRGAAPVTRPRAI